MNKADVRVDEKHNEFSITHQWDEGKILRECMEMRNDGTDGMIHNGKARRLARIPRIYFFTDPYLKEYMECRGKDEPTARKALNSFLWRHPEFRTSVPGGRKVTQ